MRAVLTLLTVTLLAAPALAQDNDAEKLYRAMEKKIRFAKTLQFTFDGEATGGGQKATLKGTVHVAEGNKGRIELVLDAGKATNVLFVSDGKNKYTKEGDKVVVEAVESKDSLKPLGMIARVGMTSAFVIVHATDKGEKKDFDLDKEVPVKGFKLGAKEMIGRREAQVVEFEITVGTEQGKASVWIDTQTQLPLKRTMVIAAGAINEVRVVETYGTVTIDGKLDPKLFELPK